MAQQTGATPRIVMNHNGDRPQVPLRDYLNTRVAPFLKKAMTESLDVEAEYPLQWLGECLINQSILYEGNPDSTNIKERFLYKFNSPSPAQSAVQSTQSPAQDQVPAESTAMPVTNGMDDTPVTEAVSQSPAPVHDPSRTNGETDRMDEGEKETDTGTRANQQQQDTEMADTS